MSRILFSHSYYYQLDPKQWKKQQPYPPLGTLFAASYMRELGHEVDLFDTNLVEGPGEIVGQIDSFKPDYLALYDDGFNYLTKMCLTNMREAAFEMIKTGRDKGCTVIVSSSDSTDHYEKYLEAGAHYVLLGEAELTLKELVEYLDEGKPVNQVLGLAYRDDHEIRTTRRRPVLKDLDDLPQPAWDLIDIQPYKDIWKAGNGYFSLNLATTRGCPFKCNWCAKPIYGNRYHSRSPERVVEEIAWVTEHFQPDHYWMSDDIFGLKPGWVQEFNRLLKEKGLSIQYTIQSRVDLLLKEDTIDALAESGLHEVWVGAESGSQKILDAMDKGTQVEQIGEATKLLHEKGVRVAFFLQFGYPGETRQDIRMTIDMVKELVPDNIGVSVSYPLPGTPFYDRVKEELSQKANWTDSDDLDLMFSNTYPKEFYRKLQRYVHKVLRREQGLNQLKGIAQSGKKPKFAIRPIMALPYYIPAAAWDKHQLNQY
ncbi:B12-binding domain-containing radical SAM protein [bacterium SCSIO 12741]|nr:B12-binding domain-containing radical SAM protein [bacterium SCSIO 12741]